MIRNSVIAGGALATGTARSGLTAPVVSAGGSK